MDKVTRQCPQTTTFLKRKESRSGIEPRSFRLPTKRLTARPNRLTELPETDIHTNKVLKEEDRLVHTKFTVLGTGSVTLSGLVT